MPTSKRSTRPISTIRTVVPEEWRRDFDRLPMVDDAAVDVPHSTIVAHFERLGRNRLKAKPERVATEVSSEHEMKQIRVLELIGAYRTRGHRKARLDPLGIWEREPAPELELGYHHLTPADLDTVFSTGSAQFFESGQASLKDIIYALEATYCGAVAAEYMYITDEREQLWVRQRLESSHASLALDDTAKVAILERLTAAEGLEKYLHAKYPGTKRFGLEGAESLIPMLHEALQHMGSHGCVEAVIGMAHRGRLNVLVNILGKDPSELFDEFEGVMPTTDQMGDVKYHQGFSSNVMTPGGEMHLALMFNPSHLEIVGPVVTGSVRARQDRRRDYSGDLVVPVIIHGDAAFAGQGVVMESFQMSQTRGYHVGGTVHVIVNNQIGFTTHRRDDARSTEYCSEVAKMVRAPILHVNGDDPEACLFAMRLAVDYRMQFRKDVVVDLVCYRRRGHNEAEDPMKTQPLMYQQIEVHPTTRELYAGGLVGEGVIDRGTMESMVDDYRDALEAGEHVALALVHEPDSSLFVDWRPYLGHDWDARGGHPGAAVATAVPVGTCQRRARRLRPAPPGAEDPRRPTAHGCGRDAVELGIRGDHGLRDTGGRRLRRATHRSGRRRRHVLPPPRLALQPARRQAHRADQPVDQRHHVRHLRLAALGRGGAGLRIRLRRNLAGNPGHLGSAVRRLCQRRPGRHRPVRGERRDKMGTSVRARHAASPRLRGAGPGAFVGAPWSATCSCRRSTTSRSVCPPPPRRSSTCCAARSSGRCASR